MSTLSPSLYFPTSLTLFCSRGALRLSSRWRRREAGRRRRRWWWRARAREEGGTWQWGDAGREISLSPSLLRGRHWAPETGACGSFTGSGCFLIHWLAMDVRRGQWREGRGRWCYWEAVLFQRQTNKLVRVLNLYFSYACEYLWDGSGYWMETLQHVYFCVFHPYVSEMLCACGLVHESEHILMHFSQTVWVHLVLFESGFLEANVFHSSGIPLYCRSFQNAIFRSRVLRPMVSLNTWGNLTAQEDEIE